MRQLTITFLCLILFGSFVWAQNTWEGSSVSTTTTGSVGIGINTTTIYHSDADNLVIYESGNGGLTIASNTSGIGSIYFADGTDPGDNARGYIRYNHSTNSFSIGTNNNEAIEIEDDKDVIIKNKIGFNTSPLYNIHSRLGSSGATASSASDDLVLETNNNTGISLLSPSSGQCSIFFADEGNPTVGRIYYNHPTDEIWFFTENKNRMIIASDGVYIGTSSQENESKLSVAGKISAQDITIKADAGGADFVFEKDYNLPSLDHVEKFVKANKHLPEIPSVKEMQENGIQVSEMQTKLLQKIEELTLYVIELKKEIEILKENN